MLQKATELHKRLRAWTSGSWVRWAIAALPMGLLAVLLFAIYTLLSRTRPAENPDLDEAKEAGKAEVKAEADIHAINKKAAELLARSKGMSNEELKRSLLDEVEKP